MQRRGLLMLAGLAAAPRLARTAALDAREVLTFPRDHGAHPATQTEWWYVTGWLGTQEAPTHGFQLTFFRSRTGLAQTSVSRFAARQLLFAHAGLTRLGPSPVHLHEQRIVRWSGAADAVLGAAQLGGGDVRIGNWQLRDTGSGWQARLDARDFGIDLQLERRQPLLLQGDAGWSRKGPEPSQASRYVSEPQLAARGAVGVRGKSQASSGTAWMDHEWSEQMLPPQAVGWDWIGINLFDGGALTAFVLRRPDGSALWAGGSWRAAGAVARSFGPDALRLMPGRRWSSPASGASYPVEWQIETPAGRFGLRALLDAQELDSRASTGTIYWEGLSELLDAQRRRVGLGYLEMTGYAGRLRL